MIRLASFVVGLIAMTIGTQVESQAAGIDDPSMHGAIVDWCSTYAKNCGAGGANLYCQKIGFASAANWTTYKPGKTWVIGSDQYCNGDFCVGFSHVTCVGGAGGGSGSGSAGGPGGGPGGGSAVGPGVSVGTAGIDNPVIGGAVVDWCSTWATNCGAGGANLYCQLKGYSGAANWATFKPGKTWVIGSDEYCVGGFCTGFSHVTCAN